MWWSATGLKMIIAVTSATLGISLNEVWTYNYLLLVQCSASSWFSLTWSMAFFFQRNKRKRFYYMAKPVIGKSYFCFDAKLQIQNLQPKLSETECHIINYFLTELARAVLEGVFVQTSLRSVRAATTSGQYSPVRPSRSVRKRLLFTSTLVNDW